MKHLKAFLGLLRVRYTGQVLGIVSLLSIKSSGFSVQSVLAIASLLFLCISLFSFDDAHDYSSDLLIHSKRPIPRGVFTVNQVRLVGAVFFCLGTFFSAFLAPRQLAFYLLIAGLGLSVVFLKLKSIIRACFIAFMIFMLFPFSMSISVKSTLFGFIVALPHISGSIVKDFIHSIGDENIGLQPPPYWARSMAGFLFFTSGAICFLPIFLSLVAWLYTIFILPTFASCIILGVKVMKGRYQRVYIFGGVGMVSALAAFATSI